MRVLSAILLLLPGVVWAGACTGREDGAACYLSGNVDGYCKYEACQPAQSAMSGGEPITGTGTISGVAAITGSGTIFTLQVSPGDVLVAGGQSQNVNQVLSDTSLTVVSAFVPTLPAGTTFTILRPIRRLLDNNGATIGITDGVGRQAIGAAKPTAGLSVRVPPPAAVSSGNGANGGPYLDFVGGFVTGVDTGMGDGGATSAANATGGTGGSTLMGSGRGGAATGLNGHGGQGGELDIESGNGGSTGGTGTTIGGNGGTITVNTGLGGTGGTNGSPGLLALQQFGQPMSFGDQGGATATSPGSSTWYLDSKGDMIRIRSVPVAGTWNVIAYEQANLGGM